MTTRKNWHYRLRYKLCEPLWGLAVAFEDWPRDFQQRGPRQAAMDRRCEAAAMWVDRKLGIREWKSS